MPTGLEIHVVMDNGSSHVSRQIQGWLVEHERFHIHHTPTSSSWLNLVSVYRPSGPGLRLITEDPQRALHGGGYSASRRQLMDVVAVVRTDTGHALQGTGPITEVSNGFLGHLEARAFSPGTIQGYAFDLLNFSRFLVDRGASLDDVVPTDLFDYLAWQAKARPTAATKVVRLADRRGAAPATMNRRIAAVRGLFEYAVITGLRTDNPVPAARRSTGLRPKTRGMLGHIAPGDPLPAGGWSGSSGACLRAWITPRWRRSSQT